MGNKSAENIKLVKARDNVTSEEHPCAERNTAVTFLQTASELADYWNLNGGMRYEPMSLEDAIWGNTTVQPIDLDTSTGAAFQTIFPSMTKKYHVIGDRGEFKGEDGVWLKSVLIEQWEHWKRGELWIMPGSYSLKAECLPIEKVWKKRLVTVCDPVTTSNSRRLMMPIQEAFVRLASDSPYQLVFNPYTDMHGLAMKMLTYDSYYDVDVSGFDLTVPKVVLDAVSVFNKTKMGAEQVLLNMFDSFFLTVSSTPVIAGKTLFSRQSGVPSGITCTSLIDSQCMQLIFCIACAQMYAYDLSPNEYYESVWTYSTGDDTIMAYGQ